MHVKTQKNDKTTNSRKRNSKQSPSFDSDLLSNLKSEPKRSSGLSGASGMKSRRSRSVDGAVLTYCDSTHMSSPFYDPLVFDERKQESDQGLQTLMDSPDLSSGETSSKAFKKVVSASQAEKIVGNQFDIEQGSDKNITYLPISNLEQNVTAERPHGVAHLRVGLGIEPSSEPHFAFALHDTGASDCLISVSKLHQLADFDKLRMSAVQKTRIRAATGDESHPVHGKIILYVTFNDKRKPGNSLQLKVPFYVVSGLTHDIFIGQSFLNTAWVSHEDSLYTYLKPSLDYTAQQIKDPKLIKVLKYRAKSLPAALKRDYHIPPGKHYVGLNHTVRYGHDDSFIYFYPNLDKFKGVHFVPQSLYQGGGFHKRILVVNQTNKVVFLPRNTVVGTVDTTFTDRVMIDNIEPYVSNALKDDQPVDLNQAVSCFEGTDIGITELHHAMVQSHEMTPEERLERSKQYKKEGYFQKTVSEVVGNLTGQPHLDTDGDSDTIPKSDDELIESCDLSHLSLSQRELAKSMLRNRLKAFQRHKLDIGKCKDIVASAPIKGGITPNVVCKYIPIPMKYREVAQQMIDKYVRAGVLKQTFESCPITSNMYIIPKPNGRGFRAVYDGRALSSVVTQLPTPMPTMEEMFASWNDSTFLSVLDVVDAYHSIPIDEKTSKMMSFFAPSGARYVYLRLAQGLKFSSHFLNNAMDRILQPVRHHTKNYADDCICSSNSTFEDHLTKVDEVLSRFIEFNIKVNISKLKLAAQEVDILGMTWKKGFLSIPKAKVMGYLNLAKPTNLKEAQFLINSLAYYRRFIPNFSEKAFPIQALITECRNTHKRLFKWLPIHQDAADSLIASLKRSTSIMLPRPDRKFVIHSDSSYEAVGGTVSQFDDTGRCQLVAAISRTFTQTERRHSAVIKEILGLLYVLKSCQYFLRGAEIEIFADAKSISLIKSCSITSPYLARLSMELSQYDFSIYHIDGRINIVADALSRLHKDKHRILRIDKEDNDGMTLEEGLRFIELLKIPTGYKFSKDEVRSMINSAPLRSALNKRVKRNLSGMARSSIPSPTLVRDRPPKMPALESRKKSLRRALTYNIRRRRAKSLSGWEEHEHNYLTCATNAMDIIPCSHATPDDASYKDFAPFYTPSSRPLFIATALTLHNATIKPAHKPCLSVMQMEIVEGLRQMDIKCGIVKNGIISVKDFRDAQDLDPSIREYREAFEQNPRLHFKTKHGILCKVKNGLCRPILPVSLEKLLFTSMHYHALSGHRSADTIIKAISQEYYVDNLDQKVKDFTSDCFLCKTHKSQRMTKQVLNRILTPKRPREICSFDIAGGFETTDGYRYLYLFVDNFSLFCTTVLAKTKTEAELKRAFLTVFSQWSEIPKVIISDQEPGTMTEDMKEFFNSFGVTHRFGAAYSPHRNVCETAAVRKVKEFLRGILSQTRMDWPQAAQIATICANQTQTTYGYTPAQIHYGDVRFPHPLIELVNPVKNLDEYIKECTKNHKKIEIKIRKLRDEFNQKKRDAANQHRSLKEFSKNDLVWVKSLKIVANRATKVFNKGPFLVLKKLSEGSYQLATLADPETVVTVQHPNNMSRYKQNLDFSPISFPQLDI